jgi:serine/threonine protein phosphatase PrpC
MGVRGIDLTEDHKPENPKERKRIERMGGTVEDSGEDGLSSSVWLPDASAGLAMSRSFGDTEFHRVGVTTEPTVTSYEIGDYDEFLILASDGIWEMLTSDQAARIVQGHGKLAWS